MSKHKILIVGAFPKKGKIIYGGIAKSCEVLLQSSLTDRFEIITLDSTQLSNPPPVIVVRGFLAVYRIFLLFIKIIQSKPSAALIFASDGWSSVEKGLMILICKLFGIKTLIFPRAGNLINQVSNSKVMFNLIKSFFSTSDIFLCQGKRWKEFAVNNLNIDESQVKTIHNWTATEKQLNIGRNRDYLCDRKVPRLIFVGWLEEFKGVFELLKACNNLHINGIKFHLTFFGEGTAENSAKEFTKMHGLNSCVTFFGWTNSSDLDNHLEESDIFVLPSWSEGLPNAMIESLAAGLAVVVTSVGVITDYIKDEKHALIVPPHNVEILEKSIKKLITDRDLRADIAFEGHRTAMNNFSVESNIAILGDIIEELIVYKQ
jgi:glycosyltransferase involved in cell wall biosynthesis